MLICAFALLVFEQNSEVKSWNEILNQGRRPVGQMSHEKIKVYVDNKTIYIFEDIKKSKPKTLTLPEKDVHFIQSGAYLFWSKIQYPDKIYQIDLKTLSSSSWDIDDNIMTISFIHFRNHKLLYGYLDGKSLHFRRLDSKGLIERAEITYKTQQKYYTQRTSFIALDGDHTLLFIPASFELIRLDSDLRISQRKRLHFHDEIEKFDPVALDRMGDLIDRGNEQELADYCKTHKGKLTAVMPLAMTSTALGFHIHYLIEKVDKANGLDPVFEVETRSFFYPFHANEPAKVSWYEDFELIGYWDSQYVGKARNVPARIYRTQTP